MTRFKLPSNSSQSHKQAPVPCKQSSLVEHEHSGLSFQHPFALHAVAELNDCGLSGADLNDCGLSGAAWSLGDCSWSLGDCWLSGAAWLLGDCGTERLWNRPLLSRQLSRPGLWMSDSPGLQNLPFRGFLYFVIFDDNLDRLYRHGFYTRADLTGSLGWVTGSAFCEPFYQLG